MNSDASYTHKYSVEGKTDWLYLAFSIADIYREIYIFGGRGYRGISRSRG